MKQQDNQEYTTDQTPLAAYLMTEGFTLKDTTFNDKIATFIFLDNSTRLQECAQDFEMLRAVANAALLIRNYQDLIKRIRRGI